MSRPDWEELFSRPRLADIPDFLCENFLARMMTTPPKIEEAPSVPARLTTTTLRSPRPKPYVSQPSVSKETYKKQKKP